MTLLYKWCIINFIIIKLNVDVACYKGKVSITMVGRNYDAEVLGLWNDDFECMLALATEMLAIEKAFIISNNFQGQYAQVEIDCKN